MIRRRPEQDDGLVHIWLCDATATADKAVCGVAGPPSLMETGAPCMPCHIQHGQDLAAKHGDVAWRT